jgi:hypothetical protein
LTIASVVIKGSSGKTDGNEGHVRRVHALNGNFFFGAFNVGILDEVLDGLDNVLEDDSFYEAGFKHGDGVW